MKQIARTTLLSLLIALIAHNFAYAEIRFHEVTQNAGILYSGRSFGASWADFNNDGHPDIFTSNHQNSPSLYLNHGNGIFSDIASSIGLVTYDDTHGSAWADFDNDGDQDLLVLTGSQAGLGTGPNLFLKNNSGLFSEMAVAYGLDYPLARGRTPLWFDYDNDGLLDVIMANLSRPDGMAPSAVFKQADDFFINANSSTDFELPEGGPLCTLTRLFDHSDFKLLSLGGAAKKYPNKIFGLTSTPFKEIIQSTPYNFVADAVIADFNGDLLPDIFLTRTYHHYSGVILPEPNLIKAIITIADQGERGFTFQADGNVTFDIHPDYYDWVKTSDIFIGSEGLHPDQLSFTLSEQDSSVMGIFDHDPGVDTGIYIGFDPSLNKWQIFLSASSWRKMFTQAKTDAPVSNLTTIGIELPPDDDFMDKLLLNAGYGFSDNSVAAGLDIPTSCGSAVAGDFDNDMDIDLYLVCTEINNSPNILLENQGNGTFSMNADAGGAQGSEHGRGETVAIADYDSDGFLDLFVTNGLGSSLFGNGPNQLFHNYGNANHWLEIDLEGMVSNRDGIGAKIEVTADGITQVRQQNGGMHKYSQNFKRIHFGLGGNTVIDHIVINWPSGMVQELNNVMPDQVLKIIEMPTQPWPSIKANNSNTNISITSSETLSITVTSEPGNHLNENADLWMMADTPQGWIYYDFSTKAWKKSYSFFNIPPSDQGPLSNLSPIEILNISNLTSGSYRFYFGIDLNMNGSLDFPKLFSDVILVNVLDDQ